PHKIASRTILQTFSTQENSGSIVVGTAVDAGSYTFILKAYRYVYAADMTFASIQTTGILR
ncbi:hypothetical protein AAIH64_35145, partial [Pseudomonas aeruginosa]